MTNNYGPATFFVTLSPSEYDWTDLKDFLCNVNNNIQNRPSTSLNKLIADDPVSAFIFLDIKFKGMLAFLTGPQRPFGNVIHWAWRREYQSRGLQHFHMLIWVKDAPVIGKDDPKVIADYINKRIPDKVQFPTLNQRVNRYQSHGHNNYCTRVIKKMGIREKFVVLDFEQKYATS